MGEYEIENESGKMEKKYGLKAFSPIAKGFEYQDYDDFGVSRSTNTSPQPARERDRTAASVRATIFFMWNPPFRRPARRGLVFF